MLRSNLVSVFGVSIGLAVVLLALSLPVPSVPESAPTNGPQAAGAADVSGVSLDGGVCSEESAQAPDWEKKPGFGRTCRCSCGYPCRTDADCGGGLGSCRAGITCC